MNNKLILLCFLSLVLLSCNNGSNGGVQEIEEPGGNYLDVIKMPISADGKRDTENVPVIQFEKDVINFGRVQEGEVVEAEFVFTNVGNAPLLITNAQSTCGCTIPQYPKELIQPGEVDTIKVRFDTKNRPNWQSKPVTIYSNTYPNQMVVTLEGLVIE